MQINSELCHVDSNKIIVKVTISENQIPLSSALGQGQDIKEAESNALEESISRLNLSFSELNQTDKKINNNQNKIDSIGPINMNIDNEYKNESKRYNFLCSQYDDLEVSLKTINETIEKLDNEAEIAFSDTFNISFSIIVI